MRIKAGPSERLESLTLKTQTFALPADEEWDKLSDPFYRLEQEDLQKKKEAEPLVLVRASSMYLMPGIQVTVPSTRRLIRHNLGIKRREWLKKRLFQGKVALAYDCFHHLKKMLPVQPM